MIIFLYGEDTYRSRKKLKEFKDKFISDVDPDGSSLVVLDGNTVKLDDVNKAVAAPSLFVRKRMVVIENIFSQKNKQLMDDLSAYLKNKFSGTEDENIIIFWDETDGNKMGHNTLFKFLAKAKFVQNFKPFSNTEANNWIRQEVKDRNVLLKPQAANLLTSLYGSDLWQLSNEIDKLANYKKAMNLEMLSGGEVVIEPADIEELCRGKTDENIFAFTDAISHRNKALALDLFEKEIEAGIAEAYLLFMIMRQFKILIQVRDGLNNGLSSRQMIGQLKLHPFVAQKAITQAGKFDIEALKQIFAKLVQLDKLMKTGKADFKSSISLMIMGL